VGEGVAVGVAEASTLADSALAEVDALDSALTCVPPEQADRVSIIAAESAARIYRYSEQALPEQIDGAFFTDGVNGFCRVGGKCVHVLN